MKAVIMVLALVAMNVQAGNPWDATRERIPETTWTDQKPNPDAETWDIKNDAYPWLDRLPKRTAKYSEVEQITSPPNVPTVQQLAGGNYWTGGCKVWDWIERTRQGLRRV
jgi:hypothetical protein